MKTQKKYFDDLLEQFTEENIYDIRFKTNEYHIPTCFHHLASFLFCKATDYYLEDDIKQAKNWFYIVSKLYLLSDDNFNGISFFIYPLLSDNVEIIKEYSLHEPTNHTPSHLLCEVDYPPYNIGKLKPETYDFRFATYALQCVLKNNWDEYHKIKELANKKFKKLPTGISFEFDFYDLLEKRNAEKIKELITLLLKPKLHKLFNEYDTIFYKVFSFHPTLFTKLCWMNGLEIEVNNPLVPMKLMPVEPLEKYDLVYDFLKPDYNWEAAKKRSQRNQRKEKILRFLGIKK